MENNKRKRACTIITVATLGFLAFTPGLLAASTSTVKVALEPGEYDFTVTYEIEGEQTARPKTAPRCIRADQLGSPEAIFSDSAFDKRQASEPCKVKNLKERGQDISYDAECSNRLVHVEGQVRGTEFSVVRSVRPKTTRGVSLKFTLQGRRTGECRLVHRKKP
jgi:Protein of unknown function (DUF3617)